MELFECDSCGRKLAYDPKLCWPYEWKMREIQGRRFLFCADCGHEGNFVGSLAPFLKRRLATRHGLAFVHDA